MSDRLELSHELRFEAAHFLPKAPPGHKCRRLHGHSFRARVRVAGALDSERGWVIDFGALDRLLAPLHEQLDHRLLNDVEGLENPTSEEIARWIWHRLDPLLAPEVALCEVSVEETCGSAVSYRGEACEPREA